MQETDFPLASEMDFDFWDWGEDVVTRRGAPSSCTSCGIQLWESAQAGRTADVSAKLALRRQSCCGKWIRQGLYVAACNDHADTVRAILENGPRVDLDEFWDRCGPVIHQAARHGAVAALRVLGDYEAPMSRKAARKSTQPPFPGKWVGRSCLVEAIDAGHAEAVDAVLGLWLQVEPRLRGGRGAVPWLPRHSQVPVELALRSSVPLRIVQALLEHKADANLCSNATGRTPLGTAMRVRNHEGAQLLLEHKASVNLRSTVNGHTPLGEAARVQNCEGVQLLLGARAVADRPTGPCGTALMIAARKQDVRIARLLLEANADASATRDRQWTALLHAIYGSESCRDASSDSDASDSVWAVSDSSDSDSSDSDSSEAIVADVATSHTSRADSPEAIVAGMATSHTSRADSPEAIVAAVATSNTSGDDSPEAIGAAVPTSHTSGDDSSDSDSSQSDSSGSDSSQIYSSGSDSSQIYSSGSDSSGSDSSGSESSDSESAKEDESPGAVWVRLLVQHKADVHARDRRGRLPLHHASVQRGFGGALEALLQCKAAVDGVDLVHGRTPLHAAAKAGQCLCCWKLLDAKAAADSVDAVHGRTPLHAASKAGQASCCDKLLAAKADVNAVALGDWSRTPLHYAAGYWYSSTRDRTCAVLLDAKANPEALDARGLKPRMYRVKVK